MSNPNFVNDLVMMAKAFEELPTVKAELETAKHDVQTGLDRIQMLEQRLIDRANELEFAHAATRKAEVERDHAETMFLETDSKLDSAKSVLKTLIGNAGEFLHVVEPPKPEPVAEDARPNDGTSTVEQSSADGQAVDDGHTKSEDMGQREADPITAPTHTSPTEIGSGQEAPDTSASSVESKSIEASEVASPPDPTASSTAGDGHSSETAQVGYATEVAASPEVPQTAHSEGVSVPSDPTQASESSSESGLNASTESEAQATQALPNEVQPDPEPELRYSPEWYQWADRVGYWNRKAQA